MSDILDRLDTAERRAVMRGGDIVAEGDAADSTVSMTRRRKWAATTRRQAYRGPRAKPTMAPYEEPGSVNWRRRAQITMTRDLYVTGHDYTQISDLLGLSSPRAAYDILHRFHGGVKGI